MLGHSATAENKPLTNASAPGFGRGRWRFLVEMCGRRVDTGTAPGLVIESAKRCGPVGCERSEPNFDLPNKNSTIRRTVQIVIEEAHRLFDRKAYDADSPNPYVRLAKEAAKLKIGLIYATQEVTAVAPAVLANTSNWIVAHLNNTNEIHTLSRYYDFKSFESAILSAEDRGFVRIKTRSGKYIVPVQVSKFDRDMINSARVDAGLASLPPFDGV